MKTEINDCDILQLHLRILEDTTLDFQQKTQLLDDVRKLMPAEQNRWTLRWVVWLLGAAVVAVPLYALVMLLMQVRQQPPSLHIPAPLLSIGSTALGALATFLTHYTRRPTAIPSGDNASPR